MNSTGATIAAFFGGIITLAMLSVILSKKSDTTGVISAVAKGAVGLVGAATAPVTGGAGLGSSQ